MESAKSTDLRNWTGFSSGVNAENKLFDNLFDGEEDGDPAAFTYVGKNEEGGYSVWAPDVIYNKKMGKYVMYFCTTSSYVKSISALQQQMILKVRITMRTHSCTLVIAIMMLRKVISKN